MTLILNNYSLREPPLVLYVFSKDKKFVERGKTIDFVYI
jgi:hypothetical protein